MWLHSDIKWPLLRRCGLESEPYVILNRKYEGHPISSDNGLISQKLLL